ncbi:glycoside hydrolase family 2 protein [Microbacterium oleivorans]|uniref:glycoside hydrolase family 2 protein n=1 Tax=Microbacterium oleivorans TaxID=273677 RepID=UPI00203A7ED8|nr:glycoside hydrolase family 2 TIM barrel-domain containing protein [Microbacterium oleivorans]MCM3695669.1 glycoside hydrolase family 2 [Microbacterium oleivorans]
MLDAMIDDDHGAVRASTQDGTYPRPQLMRTAWADLCGTWSFAHDDADSGIESGWPASGVAQRDILVPFPPESSASGIADTGMHRVVWYSRDLTDADLTAARHESGRRLLLHFGAVDYRCHVWVDGALVGSHEGGHTPFTLDVTHVARAGARVVVRVEDDPLDISQPRGKQDWREDPHVIWYHRTTGIWQPVWLESVPPLHVRALRWTTDPRVGTVTADIELSERPVAGVSVEIDLSLDGRPLATARAVVTESELTVVLALAELRNGQSYEELLWSPEHPRLLDAEVRVGEDAVASYLGIRTAHVARGRFWLNDRPYYVRSVLNQGYWPGSHLAAPSAQALREEAELIRAMGFNATRVHQKFEDPRFLLAADQLGLLIWGEAPGTYAFTQTAIERTTREWLDVVRRDVSHPSIVTWVPLNESWGVQHIASDPRMQHFARALVSLTKALDPTRPVVSNDGWEQVDTDIVAIHDYEWRPDVVQRRYATDADVRRLMDTVGPAGRALILSGDVSDAPVMLTEFGGISFDTESAENAWGYSTATSPDDFAERFEGLMAAVHASEALAGFCYTQLSDTLQETNGLVTEDRTPKIPLDRIRAAITGEAAG